MSRSLRVVVSVSAAVGALLATSVPAASAAAPVSAVYGTTHRSVHRKHVELRLRETWSNQRSQGGVHISMVGLAGRVRSGHEAYRVRGTLFIQLEGRRREHAEPFSVLVRSHRKHTLVIDYYCRIEDTKADATDGPPTVPGTRPGDRFRGVLVLRHGPTYYGPYLTVGPGDSPDDQ